MIGSKYESIKPLVIADHDSGMTSSQLAEKYGVPLGSISGILHGWEGRTRVKKEKQSTPQKHIVLRKCPNCGTVVANIKACFCWKCGADVRTEESILLAEIEKLLSILSAFPSSQSEQGIQIVLKLKKYIEERG